MGSLRIHLKSRMVGYLSSRLAQKCISAASGQSRLIQEFFNIAIMLAAGVVFLSGWMRFVVDTPPFFIDTYPKFDNTVKDGEIGRAILNGAQREVHNQTKYDKSKQVYQPLYFLDGKRQSNPVFPGGDIDPNHGVCSDLIVRALRPAGYDLQRLINEDIHQAPKAYRIEQRFNQPSPDYHIDHRRVSNQFIFFQRHAISLPTETDSLFYPQWKPGDIVVWDLNPEDEPPDHVGVVSDQIVSGTNRPYVIQNNGKTQAIDCLERNHWKVVGHFRFPNE